MGVYGVASAVDRSGSTVDFDHMRFRGGLVFKAHRLLYHSTLGLRVIKKKRRKVDLGVS